MADSFVPLSSYPSVQVTSGTQVQNVEVVTAQTIPTGITFTWAVPKTVWDADSGVPTLNSMAEYLEELAAGHHVVGGTPSQDFDASNLLTDYLDLTVEHANPNPNGSPLTGVASVPITAVVVFAAGVAAQGFGSGVPDPAGIVDAEYNRLAALAAA